MVIVGLSFGGTMSFASVSGIAILVYLSFLSAIAYAVWGILLKHNPVSKVTIFNFMTPVFGTILSKLILTESDGVSALNIVISVVLICVGIIALNYQKNRS